MRYDDDDTFGMEPWQVAMFAQMRAANQRLGTVTRSPRPSSVRDETDVTQVD